MIKHFTLSILFFISCLFMVSNLSAANCTAIASGNWDQGSTWSCGQKPNSGDIVTIPSSFTVTLRFSDILGGAATSITIEEGGYLKIDPLPCVGVDCDITFYLASGSTIDVLGENGIYLGSNAIPGQTWVFIGDLTVMHGNGDFPFGPGLLPLGALPVDLVSFSGIANDRSNTLKWQTASEENTMVFLVERSLDGRRGFKEINRVEAFGNSTSLRNYEIQDDNPVSLAYYRLRIVDFDGTFEFSDVIAIERSKTEIDLVEVYPIPAEDEVTVLVHAKADGKAIITLSDFMGRKIKEEKIELKSGINRYYLNWEDRETNFYYLTIYNGNERIAKKILRASRD